MQLGCDNNVYMDYSAHENNIINDYLGLLCKAFRGHKPNKCILSSIEFIDEVSFDNKLTTENSESLEAAHNFIMQGRSQRMMLERWLQRVLQEALQIVNMTF